MAIYQRKNFSRSRINDLSASNGDEFEYCNFHQSVPNTSILSGLTGLAFRHCNLSNCNVPGGSVIEDCLTIQKSLCSHLHENRLNAGEITECSENCSHVIDTDEIWIDGELINTIYHYKDTVL